MPDYIIIIKATTTVHNQSHMHVHITMNDRPIGDLKTSACIHIYIGPNMAEQSKLN